MDFDHQEGNPAPPPVVPGVPAEIAERVMAQTGATAEELARLVAEAKADGIRRSGP